MMLAARSCSPKVMRVFWPVMRHVPSSAGTALVRTAPRSEPAWGSVRFMVPAHSPVTIFSAYLACWPGLPCWASMSMAPWVSSGHMENTMLAEAIISCITTATSHGNPPPPNSAGNGTDPQPAWTYCWYASLNPGGVVTLPSPSRVLQAVSPTRLTGPTTSAMN
jgi:hypothetical protein